MPLFFAARLYLEEGFEKDSGSFGNVIGGIDMSQINVSGLTFGYEGSFDNIFENVSFSIDTEWKLGFAG